MNGLFRTHPRALATAHLHLALLRYSTGGTNASRASCCAVPTNARSLLCQRLRVRVRVRVSVTAVDVGAVRAPRASHFFCANRIRVFGAFCSQVLASSAAAGQLCSLGPGSSNRKPQTCAQASWLGCVGLA